MRLLAVTTLATVALISAHELAAQSPVFRAGVETVALTTTVQRTNGTFVEDLTARDFRVFEDGAEQAVSLFEGDAVPVDLALLLDTSASMTGELPAAEHAAITIIQSLSPQDRAAIVTFGDRMRWRTTLTNDHHALDTAIHSLTTGGRTTLYDALYVTLRELRATHDPDEIRRRAIVVLSDGDDTASLFSYDSVMEAVRSADTAIYTVILRTASGLSPDRRLQTAEFEMKAFAQETGARWFLVGPGRENLDGVYAAIGHELAHQYTIGYTPQRRSRIGAFHRISVIVPGARDMVIRTRAGYVEARPKAQ
jgi:Ca-activated chloride channel family protein